MENIENNELVDLSYVEELAGNKPDYIYQVLSIFMDNTPTGLKELEQLVHETDDFEAISKQAHFLKSSVGIVKIRGMHENLQKIETLSKELKNKEVIMPFLNDTVETFREAEIFLNKKMEALAPAEEEGEKDSDTE